MKPPSRSIARLARCLRASAAAGLAAACSSSANPANVSGDSVVPHIDSGAPGVSGASASIGGAADAAASDARASGDGAADGGGPTLDDGGAADAQDDDGPIALPVCREGLTWSTAARVPSIAAAGFDLFGSISASELTVAWTTSAGVVEVADRTTNTGDFAAPVALDPGSTALATGRVALMPDGLELIATLADGSSFTAFDRVSIGDAWSAPSAAEFKTIAATISESGGAFAEPVVSADGQSLFYLLTIGDAAPPILYESPWDAASHAWDYGLPLPNTEFASENADASGDGGSPVQVRRPTGASSDRRTLFFFDEVAGNERAAWRDSPSSPFDTFADLPNLPEVAPGGDCVFVYFHGTDDAGQGLFTGTGP